MSFLDSMITSIFGDKETEADDLPDDGGLAAFAKQMATELEEELKNGPRKSVNARNILKVQEGKKGARAYLIDTTEFKKAIAEELHLSIDPVIKGILKKECGEKGKGFTWIHNLYVFKVEREDPQDEFNAAMEIINDIGHRLLGDRFINGEYKKEDIAVAQVPGQDLFTYDGKFNFKKAQASLKFAKMNPEPYPVSIEWEEGGKPKLREVDSDWQPQIWEKEKPTLNAPKPLPAKSSPKLYVEERETKEKDPHWEEIEIVGKMRSDRTSLDDEKHKEALEQEKEQQKKKDIVHIRALGKIILAFRPTWSVRTEAIDCYAGHVYRKTQDAILTGLDVYPEDAPLETINKIDRAICHQATIYLKEMGETPSTKIVLPLHLNSMNKASKEMVFEELLMLPKRTLSHVWIEVIGISPRVSPKQVAYAMNLFEKNFGALGMRFELGDVSRSLIERSKAKFLSCDVAESATNSIQMRGFKDDLPEMIKAARDFNMAVCVCGARNHDDVVFAIKSGSSMVNGNPLAREVRKPGQMMKMPASKLLAL